MKISTKRFKTISDLNDFEIRQLNVISGVNSSGKSSFIQLLLLLKQTINLNSSSTVLAFNSTQVNLGNYSEVIYKQNVSDSIYLRLSFDNREFSPESLEYLKITNCQFIVSFGMQDESVVIQSLEVKYLTPEIVKQEQWIKFLRSTDMTGKYRVSTNTGAFSNDLYQALTEEGEDDTVAEVIFSAFMPQTFEITVSNPNYPAHDKNKKKSMAIVPKIKELRELIEDRFNKISYIGPLRESPRDNYLANKNDSSIGPKGEFAAFFLEREAVNEIEYFQVLFDEFGAITPVKVKSTLTEGVNFWICTVFNLAKGIKSEEYKDEYVVRVTNHFDVITTIKHVGFGISQILPIVVEGLRMPKDGILVLEQPEIHLHPKVQSLLFDFLYSLTLSGKKVIVETHSDHLIVRMRRRIAEDKGKEMLNNVNLVFVEEGEREHVFRKLDMTDLGSLTYFPKDFVEQTDSDYRAIVRAQALKRADLPKK